LGHCVLDTDELLDGLGRARAAAAEGDHGGALRAVHAALRAWGEPLAEDVDAEWARVPRERLARARVDALELAADAALALGRPADAARAAREAADAEPLRESATILEARALAAGGNRAGALARLAQLRARLADELGVDPCAEAADLLVALLRGELPQVARPAPPVRSRAPTFDGLAFVGRDRELVELRAAVAAGSVATVAGSAGVGKSRLLAELTRQSADPVLAVRAFLPERAEAWGLARSLLAEALAVDAGAAGVLPDRARNALAGLVPELGGGPVAPLDPESRRALVLAGGVRLLEAATAGGALLVVDDLQWADPSSLALLRSALARLPRLPAVLAFRPDELPAAELAELRAVRSGPDLVLGALDADAVHALVADQDLAGALLAGTDATPFAIAEVLRALSDQGLAGIDAGRWHGRGDRAAAAAVELGRDGQRRAVRRRAQRQDGLRATVLALLALLAREVPAGLLARASGSAPADVLAALAALAAAGLVRLGEQGWATAHDLVAETVTAALPDAERGRLHALLADALAGTAGEPAQVARHYRLAGDATTAADWCARAARRALAAHATRETTTLATTGLDLSPTPPVRAALLDTRAEARAAHGDLAGALADLSAALEVPAAGPDRARRRARLAMLSSGAHDLPRAADLAELALVEATGDDAATALCLETASILDMNLQRADRAAARAERALQLYQSLGDAAGVARVLDGQAMATFLAGRITEGVQVFGRVAALFADTGELLKVITPRSTRGHGLVFAARPADGLAETSAALALATELDAPEGRAYALWHRSEALSGLARWAEAEADAREALRIARTIDHRGWTATSWRAIGIALTGQHRLDAAARAFAASADAAGDSLTLFASWAASRGADVAIRRGRLHEAAVLVERALALGPPLGHYEARLSRVQLAAARGDADLAALAADARALARAGGHAVTTPQLAALTPGDTGTSRQPATPPRGDRPVTDDIRRVRERAPRAATPPRRSRRTT
jgi:hypothetical protein